MTLIWSSRFGLYAGTTVQLASGLTLTVQRNPETLTQPAHYHAVVFGRIMSEPVTTLEAAQDKALASARVALRLALSKVAPDDLVHSWHPINDAPRDGTEVELYWPRIKGGMGHSVPAFRRIGKFHQPSNNSMRWCDQSGNPFLGEWPTFFRKLAPLPPDED